MSSEDFKYAPGRQFKTAMNNPFKPLVLIPSYNTGRLLPETVSGALAHAVPHSVWVVIDGSTDGSERPLEPLREQAPNQLRVFRRERNGGKGTAVLHGLEPAIEAGFTHVLTMDADGQHPADHIPEFFRLGERFPDDLIMGNPVFGPDVPFIRLKGRKLTLWCTTLETPGAGLGDTMFGMRLYPLEPLRKAFRQTRFARGYDFDPEVAVRMVWMGHHPRQLSVPVRYPTREEGGISHFNYLRDNIKLTFMHVRLIPELLLLRLIPYLKYRRAWTTDSKNP